MSAINRPVPGQCRRAVVLGAGIIGVTTAYALQRRGFSVKVVDRDEPGRGCSYGNGGAISPDFCVPIAMPGMLKRVPRWLLDPEGPLVVRWRDLPRSIPWLLRWIKAGQADRLGPISEALRQLHASSYRRYLEILGPSADGLMGMTGQLYLWGTNAPNATETLANQIRDNFGIETRMLNRDEIREIDPELAPIFARGQYFPDNGQTVNPLRLVQTIADLVKRNGGEILKRQTVKFEFDGSHVESLRCVGDVLEADIFVIAAGIASKHFAKSLGDDVPLQAERGYSLILPNPGVRPRIKVSNRDYMFGVTSMEEGVRIAGTVEIADADAPMDDRRPRVMLQIAKRMYPRLNVEGAEPWVGSRPSTPDSLPIIDRSSRFPNVIYAFGHGHTGLTGAPMTAEIAASLAANIPPPIDPTPFSLKRFSR
ncbi:glycine/D-amino acid oxidase-like deaminating enzyme [Bradyrhizobium sp. LM2.7]